VEARSDIEAFERAMAKLPNRACNVMRLMSLEGKTIQETAEFLGVSVRTVAADLQMAMKHCAASLDRTLVPRLGGPRPRS
jgi:RNA polymerase sigma-70 factor (ECF subfamily)